jgi:hypothetical protein
MKQEVELCKKEVNEDHTTLGVKKTILGYKQSQDKFSDEKEQQLWE